MPGLPFIGNYHGIDFGAATDEAGYRRAFGMLVKALAGEPPGPDPHHAGPLILPPGLAADRPMPPSQRGAIDEALLLLRSPNPVAILAQRHYPLMNSPPTRPAAGCRTRGCSSAAPGCWTISSTGTRATI